MKNEWYRQHMTKQGHRRARTIGRRLLTGALSLCMIVTAVPLTASANTAETKNGGVVSESNSGLLAEGTTTAWDGSTIADSFAGGDGTEANPYQIATAEQLAFMAQQINDSNTRQQYESKYYELTADIDLNGKEWTKIGERESLSFKGRFDGKNHTVKGLYVSVFIDNRSYGLFGACESATIQNLTVEGTFVHRSRMLTMGGVCAIAEDSTFLNCHSRVTIASEQENVNSGLNVGGICGIAKGACSFSACSNAGALTVKINMKIPFVAIHAGGIAGLVSEGTKITNCSNSGEITVTCETNVGYAGGVAGKCGGTVTGCSNTATITAKGYVGGICGYAEASAKLIGCYHTSGKVHSLVTYEQDYYIGAGGIVGGPMGAGQIGCVYKENSVDLTGSTVRETKSGKSMSQDEIKKGTAAGRMNAALIDAEEPLRWCQKLGTDAEPSLKILTDDLQNIVYPTTNCRLGGSNDPDTRLEHGSEKAYVLVYENGQPKIQVGCACGQKDVVYGTMSLEGDLLTGEAEYNGKAHTITVNKSEITGEGFKDLKLDEMTVSYYTYDLIGDLKSVSSDAPKDAGKYRAELVLPGGDGGSVTLSVPFTIKERELTVTSVEAAGRPYDGTDKITITKVHAEGVLEGDVVNITLTNDKGECYGSGEPATLSSANVGTYEEVTLPELHADGNYTVKRPEGPVPFKTAVKITKSEETTITGASELQMKFGQTVALGLTTKPAGAKMSYKVEGENPCVEVDENGNVTAKAVGTATIKVSVEGTENYPAAASEKTVTITVTKQTSERIDLEDRFPMEGGSGELDLSQYLPADCGSVTYGTPDTNYKIVTGVTVTTEGVLSYTVSAGTEEAEDYILIPVETENYEVFYIRVDLCRKVAPVCLSAYTVSDITKTTAVVTVGAEDPVDCYYLYYTPDASAELTAEDLKKLLATKKDTTGSFTLSGLTEGTTYYVFVAAFANNEMGKIEKLQFATTSETTNPSGGGSGSGAGAGGTGGSGSGAGTGGTGESGTGAGGAGESGTGAGGTGGSGTGAGGAGGSGTGAGGAGGSGAGAGGTGGSGTGGETGKDDGSTKTEKEPQIKDDNGAAGWESIRKDFQSAKSGATVTVQMNGALTVPGKTLKSLKGKDVNVTFEFNNKISLTINGSDISGFNFKNKNEYSVLFLWTVTSMSRLMRSIGA